jgi:RsiW-degrading membrane proteinase PrsW (M82 family)
MTDLEEELMQADLINKRTDTDYKRGLQRVEPWKLVISCLVAGAVLMGGSVALLNYIAPHNYPPGTVITIPK